MSFTSENSKRILLSTVLAGASVIGGVRGYEYLRDNPEKTEVIREKINDTKQLLPENLPILGNPIPNESQKEVTPQIRETIGHAESDKLIMIDAGHGLGNASPGVYDPGAVYGELEEADITLDISKRVSEKLAERGYVVKNTRESKDIEIPLRRRAQNANELGADIFVSIHVNSYDGESDSARGVRTYHFPGSEEGEELGRYVQDNLVEALEKKVEGFEQDYEGLREGNKDWIVLRRTKMPAILIEPGFIINERDRKYLTEHPEVVAEGIAEGITEYLTDNPE